MLKPIEYVDKGTDYSASDFTRPAYQLWISKRKDVYKNTEQEEVFNASFVGSLIHQNSESLNEINVIKEFSTIKKLGKYTIGGTIDRLVLDKNGAVIIEDIKSGGHFPMLQKWKEKEKDNQDWVTQLSVYRWLISSVFKQVETYGKIHVFVLGYQKNKDNMPVTWNTKVWLNEHIDTYMKIKIDIAESDTEPKKDCEKWRCSYCDYSTYCQTRNNKPKEFS